MMRPDPAVLEAQDKSACLGYGFKAATDAFAQCMQLRDMQRQASDDAARARVAASLNQMSANLNAQSIANRPVTCNSMGNANRFGNSVYGNTTTTCY